MEGQVEISAQELLNTGAVDSPFFCKHWFGRTTRQGFAPFHYELFDGLDNPDVRFFNEIIFRAGAKTSIARMWMAKRIAYNVSRTILYIGANEPKANQTIRWIKRQIEFNHAFANFFQLSKGSKWAENEIELWHGTDNQPIWLLGVGITSNSLRGINFDDYRPDLIICDDVLTDENCTTEESRVKLAALLGGAVKNSLAPRVDNPNAKMALLNTPQHPEDFCQRAKKSEEWVTIEHGCWTKETADLPVEYQISAWESRHPTADLRLEKRSAENQGELSTFLREKEVRLTSPENASFKRQWLKFWDEDGSPRPPRGTIVISIDPTPPLAPHAVAKNLQQKDFEAVAVCMRSGGNYYLLAYDQMKGQKMEWLTQTVIRFITEYRPIKVIIESNAAQVAIGLLLKQELERVRIYIYIHFKQNTAPKYTRITTGLAGIGFAGRLYCSKQHTDFINDFQLYPQVPHDDLLDAVASGMSDLISPLLEDVAGEDAHFSDPNQRPLKIKRRVP
jgi:phage terminase large subunit-like protein